MDLYRTNKSFVYHNGVYRLPVVHDGLIMSNVLGPAVAITIVLRDWEKYGLTERVAYHFWLTDALIPSTVSDLSQHKNESDTVATTGKGLGSVCGVASLLECVPTVPWHKLTRKQKKALKNEIAAFDENCRQTQRRHLLVYEPTQLPLRLNPSTRVMFGYETTRLALVLDASPSLTSTYGVTGDATTCCPLDRLPEMATTFFTSLVEPIVAQNVFYPQLAVTVLAVYSGSDGLDTSVLVRDYRVNNQDSAELLAGKIEEWALGEVEATIASRLGKAPPNSRVFLTDPNRSATMPQYVSNLQYLLEAGQAALSTLSSGARPCLVLATDGRSLSCDAELPADAMDTSLVVLDLSDPSSHEMGGTLSKQLSSTSDAAAAAFHLLSYNPEGAMFPLHLSDDMEDLYNFVARQGCFFDASLLQECAKNKAGHVDSESPLNSDHFFTFKRHAIRPNGIQWYVLFSLSPLSPTYHGVWGRLPPPEYIRRRVSVSTQSTNPAYRDRWERPGSLRPSYSGINRQLSSASLSERVPPSRSSSADVGPRKGLVRTTFSTYIINPIRIQDLLMMRVKEGYHAKQYGQSTNDPDKVYLVFVLPIQAGTVVHYELSYKALAGHSRMIGFAHIKIELSGEENFVQMVKADFLANQSSSPEPWIIRLCKMMRSIRNEDMLQSYLAPVRWSDQLIKSDTPFLRRLETLSANPNQRHLHFRRDEFDCVCTGRMPYLDAGFLSEFAHVDDGTNDLVSALTRYADQTIRDGALFVKRMTGSETLPSYCIIEMKRAVAASRVFTIYVDSSGASDAACRLTFLRELRQCFSGLKHVQLLEKQMGQYVVGIRRNGSLTNATRKQVLLENQHNHASWDLINDHELFPLLMKRRTEIGEFLLLDSTDSHALFAKLVAETYPSDDANDPGDLVQYQFAIMADKVVVDLHMESEGGQFFPFRGDFGMAGSPTSKFHTMTRILCRRDQECGRALQCRTQLLRNLEDIDGNDRVEVDESKCDRQCVLELLEYALRSTMHLTFFSDAALTANESLLILDEEALLSMNQAKVARLAIDSALQIGNFGAGFWYLVAHDSDTLSIVHLPLQGSTLISDAGEVRHVREVTLFTLGISDLYSTRDDIADDLSAEDHISEYLCVSDFVDNFRMIHDRNFPSSAYMALRKHIPGEEPLAFHLDDFSKVLQDLSFTEIGRIVLAGESDGHGPSKLINLLGTVLHDIPDDHYCLFFENAGQDELFVTTAEDDSDVLSIFGQATTEQTAGNNEETADLLSESSSGNLSSLVDKSQSATQTFFAPTPIFVRIELNDIPAMLEDLRSIRRSTVLTIFLSTFADQATGMQHNNAEVDFLNLGHLPASHVNAAVEIAALLNAFVAEQSLERLRECGKDIATSDLRLAKSSLRKARDVVSVAVDVYYYSVKRDAMLHSAVSVDGDNGAERIFDALETQLKSSDVVEMRAFRVGRFAVIDTDDKDDALKYWAFVSVDRVKGHFLVDVRHPIGEKQAASVADRICNALKAMCHKAIQHFLLQQLHKGRAASELLVPAMGHADDEEEGGFSNTAIGGCDSGSFACPVVFRSQFALFHRCATNPGQVARTLEATVLHIFAVSNRRNLFVYKDEVGSVFYMTLEAHGGGIEPDGYLELVVHGLGEPDESVTSQLRRLLSRRLLGIAVEVLAAVLTKNSRYVWRHEDLTFVNNFESEWQDVVEGPVSNEPRERFYGLPKVVSDPRMVMLYLRQNLCGSTFFHPLAMPPREERDNANYGFVLYFNSAASKLDSKFQLQSTLTKKGAEYSRLAGNGLAIINFSLIDASRGDVDTADALGSTGLSNPLPRVRAIHGPSANAEMTEEYGKIKVSILDTALKREVLLSWLELTVNQACYAWAMEKYFEGHQRSSDVLGVSCIDPGENKSSLIELLDHGANMPHPAVVKVEHGGSIASSVVATLTYELATKVILEQIRLAANLKAAFDLTKNLCILRRSRNSPLGRVAWNPDGSPGSQLVQITDVNFPLRAVADSPIDCPEYICIYCWPEWVQTTQSPEVDIPKMFEEVNVDSGSNDAAVPTERLQKEKQNRQAAFRRSFAFVLTVKRNQRQFIAYNWNAQLFKKTSAKLLEREAAHVAVDSQFSDVLQSRALRGLKPPNQAVAVMSRRLPRIRQSTAASKPESSGRNAYFETSTLAPLPSEEEQDQASATSKISRPHSIRRPKLIGKSMEGAAAQAMAASRARASSSRYKPSAPVQPSNRARTDEGRPAADAKIQSRQRGQENSAQHQEDDPRLIDVRAEINDSMDQVSKFPLVRHNRQARWIERTLTYPRVISDVDNITMPALSFLLAQSRLQWSHSASFAPFPSQVGPNLPLFLATVIRSWNPTTSLFSCNDGTRVFLVSKPRNLRTKKCFACYEFCLVNGYEPPVQYLSCKGWIAVFPRENKKNGYRLAPILHVSRYSAQSATALDFLGNDTEMRCRLGSVLFDFRAFLAERTLKSSGETLTYAEAYDCVRHLLLTSTIRLQMKQLHSTYKVYEVPIVLRSYRDTLIDLFAPHTMFEWLADNVKDRPLLKSGAYGLCFKREIVVKGTHSVCFLTETGAATGSMHLVILCRSQGRDLFQFMFREGSNVAITILNNIAVEGAGLALIELRAAAQNLYRDQVWNTLSVKMNDTPRSELLVHLDAILKLGQNVVVVNDSVATAHHLQIALDYLVDVEWESVVQHIAEDAAFMPSRRLSQSDDPECFYLLYLRGPNVFVIISYRPGNKAFSVRLLGQNGPAVGPDVIDRIVQMLVNYTLHWMWSDIL